MVPKDIQDQLDDLRERMDFVEEQWVALSEWLDEWLENGSYALRLVRG